MKRPSLPQELTAGLVVRSVTPVAGGDIAQAFRVDTDDGPLFAKMLPDPPAGMFPAEAAGLRALREHSPEEVGVPEVVRESEAGLLLSWIDVGGARTQQTESALGRGLAHLHSATRPTVGGVQDATHAYLGAVEIDADEAPSWPEFYLTRRLRPLVRRAVEEGALDPEAHRLLDRLEPRIDDLCGPAEPAALVHGDLWGGNRLVDRGGRNWLIDPSAHYAHREIDIAMMQLFGGFGPGVLAAYDEVHPLALGWQERVPWYQLPPLLVHAILFGGGYGRTALEALRRYT